MYCENRIYSWLAGSLFVLCLLLNSKAVLSTQSENNEAGIAPYPASLAGKIQAALEMKPADYRPRTEHLDAAGVPRFTNRLILEASPYLQQHAHNPVDWYPWGAEAFAAAEKQNKPVFLSIGYSTCHWCHVMERESFDNLEIARFLNAHFISIKVDREQYPDVDNVYMTAVVLLNGEGGWPMNSFLTPAGKTIYGATYFPPEQFLGLLKRMHQEWQNQRQELLNQAEMIAGEVKDYMQTTGTAVQIDQAVIDQAADTIMRRYDDLAGGFGTIPKFPNENYLLFLLGTVKRKGDQRLLSAVEHSLTAMEQGGIYDQIGGGFHRYATDLHWREPHFEKMLYNQANLARVYLAAYVLTGRKDYLRIAQQTLDHVLHEMTAKEGGFYSGIDAENDGREGAYYLWTPAQITNALDKDDAGLVIDLYNVKESGKFDGANVLYLSQSIEQYANNHNYPLPEFYARLESIRQQLLKARNRRPRPERDEKVVTAWNGIMITTLAEAGSAIKNERYMQAAKKAAGYLNRYNKNNVNKLWRSSLHGRGTVPAGQEDYAYLAEGLIALFDASGEERWLAQAESLTDVMVQQFWDEGSGGFYMTAGSPDVPLMVRPKDKNDTAIPSGNAVALRVLSALAKRTGENVYLKQAQATLAAFSDLAKRIPENYAYMLVGADELLHGEQGARQYAAGGKVTLYASLQRREQSVLELSIGIDIKPGWHINAHRVLNEDLIPTVISIDDGEQAWTLDEIIYPKGKLKKLGFSQERLALYEGNVDIRARLRQGTGNTVKLLPVKISLQACSDKVCLLPETVILKISTVLPPHSFY